MYNVDMVCFSLLILYELRVLLKVIVLSLVILKIISVLFII